MIDDEKADGRVGGFEFQSQLVLESFAEADRVLGDGLVSARSVVHPREGEVVEPGYAGLIDDWTRHRGETSHRGDGSREEREGDCAATVVLTGSGRGNVRDDAADGRKIADS